MRAAERLQEINLMHQRRRGVDPQEIGEEVDDDDDTSHSGSSSSSDCLMNLVGMVLVMVVEMVVR